VSEMIIEPRRLRRVWMPVVTLLLGAGGMTALVMADALDPILQFFIMLGFIFGTPLLLAVWALGFSGLRWWQRLLLLLGGGLVGAGVVFGLTQVLKFDGAISGSGIPRLNWKWARPLEARLADLQVASQGERVEFGEDKDTDYPPFLGRDRDGVAHGVRLVRDWKERPPKEIWRKPIGLGWSAFAVKDGFAITQEQREDRELVVCYELKTGKVLWKHEHEVRLHDQQGGDGPRCTPTFHDGRVYTLGGTGILDCIDGATGKNLWSHDTLGENDLSNIIWGKSCSPLVFDDMVVVTGGKEKRDSLLAYDRVKGNLLWKAGSDDASYSSPALATLAGKKQILSVNAHSVTGHDPKDGKVLWDYSWPSDWAKASQPVVLPGDRIFLTAGYGVGCVMLHLTKGAEGTFKTETLWENRNLRTQFSNVVVARNCAFGLDERYLTCVDLETGERKWKGDRYDFGQVMLVGDLIVVQAEKGFVALVEADPAEFKELARLPALKSKTWNNPVLSGPYLLVRNDQEAVCYELPVEEKHR
jgi:outer membrane protein assembly factor BamB